jgi:hypothetical protein
MRPSAKIADHIYPPGDGDRAIFTLPPGSYALLCNLVEHRPRDRD